MSAASPQQNVSMAYDPENFPNEITHPSGEVLVIDRSRSVVFDLSALTALSLGRAASEEQQSIVRFLLKQPLEPILEKASMAAHEMGLRLEDEAGQQTRAKVNQKPWQLWIRSESGDAITQQQISNIADRLRSEIGWQSLLGAPIYRLRNTRGTMSLLSPLPHVLGVKLATSDRDKYRALTERLSERYGLQEADISPFLPGLYRCFGLRDPGERSVYQLPTIILAEMKDLIEDAFFDFMSLFTPAAQFLPDDKYYQIPGRPTDPYQWNLYKIEAEACWNSGSTPPVLGAGVTVAVIDAEGCELNSHPDMPLSAFASQGITITYTGIQNAGAAALQNESHGTLCAGIIAARCNNATEGIAGIAGMCQILPIRFESSTDLVVSTAIGYAVQQKARVISMSFGGELASPLAYKSPLMQQSIIEAFSAAKGNAVICAATMNDGSINFIPYPAAYPEVLACGASTQSDTRAAFSNYGENPNSGGFLSVVAPGVDIPSTANKGQGDSPDKNYTVRWSGTSAATPHVAALAALMISVNPGLTSLQVKNFIEETADKVPDISDYLLTKANGKWCLQLGYGRINAYAAIQKTLDTIPPAAPKGLGVT